MSSINFFRMKEELKAFGIEFSSEENALEIREKFNELPITNGQIEHLERIGISYKNEWNWTRGFTREFLKKSNEYFKLRDKLPASPCQMVILLSKGVHIKDDLTSSEAANLIYNLPAEIEQLLYIKKYRLKVGAGIPLTYGYCEYLIKKRESFLKKTRMNATKNSP